MSPNTAQTFRPSDKRFPPVYEPNMICSFKYFLPIFAALSLYVPHVAAQAPGEDAAPTLVPQSKTWAWKNAKAWEPPASIRVQSAEQLPEALQHCQLFCDKLSRLWKRRYVAEAAHENASIVVEQTDALAPEEYRLTVNEDQVKIEVATFKGLCHATATLLQLAGQHATSRSLPAIVLEDQPQTSYRCFMVDLGRNPHTLESLQQMIDVLWFYKMDSLHLHLTDDQRIAFPSRAFPKLQTEDQAISWEAFSDLNSYARLRGITLIPELEVPGHCSILIARYPEFFGTTPTELATLPKARKAIKTLIDEMLQLFPDSPFFHVGGDEAFGVPEQAQRDLINDLHEYLKEKNKTTIVWEGPALGQGDNKVSPEVIHINWNTVNFPADQMLKAGYPVVNASWDPLYVVDHYPRDNFTMASPDYIYQNLRLNRFAHFDPNLPTFLEPIITPESSQLIGFCMPWWEGRDRNLLAQCVPRVIPLAEIAWNLPTERDLPAFHKRLAVAERTRKRAFFPVSIIADGLAVPSDKVFHHTLEVTLETDQPGDIFYTLDGSDPKPESSRYQSPIQLEKSARIRTALFQSNQRLGHISEEQFSRVEPIDNLALGKPVTSSATAGPPFSLERVTDGGTGNLAYYLGYPTEPEPISIVVDLQRTEEIGQAIVHHFFNGNTFESYSVWVSEDGVHFTQVADRSQRPSELSAAATHSFPATRARYVKIEAHGCKGYVFDSFSKITEIEVRPPQ